MRSRIISASLALVGALAVASCASISPNALPQPGKTFGDGYDVVIEFDNVLNLPERAKVVMNGTEVGVVTNVAVASQQVDVNVRIAHGVVVPANAHAALQQATVLGDIFVTLESPTDQPVSPGISAGATIPLAQTTSPPQLEDTIAQLASFVTSGSIQRLQNSIVGINRVQPPGGPAGIRRVVSQVASDLQDLSDNIDVVDKWLEGVSGTADVLYGRLASAQYWFSARGMVGLDRASQLGGYLSKLFPTVGIIYSGGYWLVPLLNSLSASTSALQQSKWNFEDEWPAWRTLFTDGFLQQAKHPAINITSIVGPDGRELSTDAADVLRILGATP